DAGGREMRLEIPEQDDSVLVAARQELAVGRKLGTADAVAVAPQRAGRGVHSIPGRNIPKANGLIATGRGQAGAVRRKGHRARTSGVALERDRMIRISQVEDAYF